MPYSEMRVVLNLQVVGEGGTEARTALRKLFPGIVITERDGDGSPAIVLDVQGLNVDAVSHETYFESRGEEVALEFERALKAELQS